MSDDPERSDLESKIRERIGRRICELRVRDNLSQDELAATLDVAGVTISNWERGRTSPSSVRLCLMAGLFAVSADSILGID